MKSCFKKANYGIKLVELVSEERKAFIKMIETK